MGTFHDKHSVLAWCGNPHVARVMMRGSTIIHAPTALYQLLPCNLYGAYSRHKHLLIWIRTILFHVTSPHIRVGKVSMLTHTYPHKPLGKIKWPYAITKLTTYFTCSLMSDLAICKFRKSMVIHDTNVLTETKKQQKPNPFRLTDVTVCWPWTNWSMSSSLFIRNRSQPWFCSTYWNLEVI